MAAVPIQTFWIVSTPHQDWGNRPQSLSRGRKSARVYNIVLILDDGQAVLDKMVWHSCGSGRDCFKLENHELCVKWFSEVDIVHLMDRHMCELTAFRRAARTTVGAHVPQVHACRKQSVFGHGGNFMQVDCILADFVGVSLATLLRIENSRWRPASRRVLQQYFLAMLHMCERAFASELEWHEDFDSESIHFNLVTDSCYFSSLPAWKDRTCSFGRAAHIAARRQTRDVDRLVVDGPGLAFQFWKHLLQTHMLHKHDCALDVQAIARHLAQTVTAVEVTRCYVKMLFDAVRLTVSFECHHGSS